MRFFLLILLLTILSGQALAQSDAVFEARGSKPMSLDEYKDVPKGLLFTRDERKELEEKERAATIEKNPPADSETKNIATVPDGAPEEKTAPTGLMPYEDIVEYYRAGNFEKCVKALTPLAEGGHHGAEELLGVIYRMGQGVEKNPQLALTYLQKAAEQSRPLAQHHLGIMYYQGEGVDADSAKAMMWLTLAILYYPEGAEKEQAKQDKENVALRMTRREKDNAFVLTRDWLEERGEAHLLEQERN